jgi:hypothetical protein
MEEMRSYGGKNYLYSTYYSFPLAIFLFLIRMEPFTKLRIDLQDDRFDHVNRIFSSVASCYQSVAHAMSDYRELVHEFFYDGEFLSNLNGFDLGEIDGQSVCDVALPP